MIDWWLGLTPRTHHIVYLAAGTAVVLEIVLQIAHHRRGGKGPKW